MTLNLQNGAIAFIFPKENGQTNRGIIGYIIYLNNNILTAEQIESIDFVNGDNYKLNNFYYDITPYLGNKVNRQEIQKIYGLQLSKSWWKKNKYIEHNNYINNHHFLGEHIISSQAGGNITMITISNGYHIYIVKYDNIQNLISNIKYNKKRGIPGVFDNGKKIQMSAPSSPPTISPAPAPASESASKLQRRNAVKISNQYEKLRQKIFDMQNTKQINITFEIDSNNNHDLLRSFLRAIPDFTKLFNYVITRRGVGNSLESSISNGNINTNTNKNLPIELSNKFTHLMAMRKCYDHIFYIDDNPEHDPKIDKKTADAYYDYPQNTDGCSYTIFKLISDATGGIVNYLSFGIKQMKLNGNFGVKFLDLYILEKILELLKTHNELKILFKIDFDCTLARTHLFKTILNTGQFRNTFLQKYPKYSYINNDKTFITAMNNQQIKDDLIHFFMGTIRLQKCIKFIEDIKLLANNYVQVNRTQYNHRNIENIYGTTKKAIGEQQNIDNSSDMNGNDEDYEDSTHYQQLAVKGGSRKIQYYRLKLYQNESEV